METKEMAVWKCTTENIAEIQKNKYAIEILKDLSNQVKDFKNGNGALLTNPVTAIEAIIAMIDLKTSNLHQNIMKIGMEDAENK